MYLFLAVLAFLVMLSVISDKQNHQPRPDAATTVSSVSIITRRALVYERVHLPLYQVADASFHIQGNDMCSRKRKALIRTYAYIGTVS